MYIYIYIYTNTGCDGQACDAGRAEAGRLPAHQGGRQHISTQTNTTITSNKQPDNNNNDIRKQIIKAGDRAGAARLMRGAGDEAVPVVQEPDLNTSAVDYGSAVAAQRLTMWHREALATVAKVLRDAGAETVLDIGSSFNPLGSEFPSVTAIDAVPEKQTK